MKNFFLLVLWMFLFSCSKENKIEQKLNGSWQITKVTIKDGEGFIYESSLPKGYVSFNIENNTISSHINLSSIIKIGLRPLINNELRLILLKMYRDTLIKF